MKLAFSGSHYYLKFGLDRDPFPLESTPKKLFLTHDISRLFTLVVGSIKNQSQTLIIQSSPGGGKSVLAEYLTYIKEANWHTCLLKGHKGLERIELAHTVISQHFPDHRFDSQRACAVLEEVLRLYKNNAKLPLIIVDDAHLLSTDCLNYLYEIANLSVSETRFRLVLFTNVSENERISKIGLRSTPVVENLHFRLPTFSLSQTEKYLEHRLALAGESTLKPFENAEVDSIFKTSTGIPGEIDALAREHMQSYVIPGRNRQLLIRSLSYCSASVVLGLALYLGFMDTPVSDTSEKDIVSISLSLPESNQILVNENSDNVIQTSNKKLNIVAKGKINNRDVLTSDMQTQRIRVEEKITAVNEKKALRIQLANYDKLALRVSDVLQN